LYASDDENLRKMMANPPRKWSSRIRRCLQKWQVTTAVRNATDCCASSALVTGALRLLRSGLVLVHVAFSQDHPVDRERLCPRTREPSRRRGYLYSYCPRIQHR